jgi:acetyl-CoA C-acetyltransferase
MSALDAGYDVRASAVTLDRFCGSGITSVNMAAASIMAGRRISSSPAAAR